MCLHKFGAGDSWLNSWEHRGEDMYCPRALLKILGSGTTFFFCVKDRHVMGSNGVLFCDVHCKQFACACRVFEWLVVLRLCGTSPNCNEKLSCCFAHLALAHLETTGIWVLRIVSYATLNIRDSALLSLINLGEHHCEAVLFICL